MLTSRLLPADIDLQAVQLIYGAEDKLATLKHLAQNFPRYAGALSRRVPIDPAVFEEIAENQPRVRGGLNLAWLNGVSLEEKDMTPFGYVLHRSSFTIKFLFLL